MRILLNAQDTEASLDRIAALVDQVRAAHRDLRRRHAEDRDGYPTRSSLDGGGHGGTVLDDRGDPMPPLNDPVGELVIGLVDVTDDCSRALADLVRQTRNAQRELEGALMAAGRARPPEAPPVQDVDQLWCRSHLRVNACEPIFEKSRARRLCRWCAGFEDEYGQLPPKKLLEMRGRGMKINQPLIDEALKNPR